MKANTVSDRESRGAIEINGVRYKILSRGLLHRPTHMHEAHFHIHLTLVYLHLLLYLQFVRFYLHVHVMKRCVYVRKAGTMERYWGGEFDHLLVHVCCLPGSSQTCLSKTAP